MKKPQENEHLAEVEAYLQGNAQLRHALGLEADKPLQIRPLGKGEHNENFVFWAASEDAAASEAEAVSETETAGTAEAAVAAASEDAGTATAATAAARTKYVLRINRIPQPFHDNQVAYEFAALKALEPTGCAPRALYLDDSPTCLGKGVLVETFCEGQELDFDNLRPGDLQCAAQLMANVHAAPVPASCPLFQPDDPLQALFDECVSRFKVYQGTALEDPRYTRWIERFFAATLEAMDAAPAPTQADRSHIINTETLPSHFLIPAQAAASSTNVAKTSATAHPGTFVDWERPIIAEPAQDLAFFVAPSTTFWDSDYLFPRQNIQDFLETYWRAVDGRFPRGTFDQRFEAYLRVSVLRSQTWFCKNAARYVGEGTGHTVERTFKKWGIYTSDEFNQMLLTECFQ